MRHFKPKYLQAVLNQLKVVREKVHPGVLEGL
jgi:hypothetical protein